MDEYLARSAAIPSVAALVVAYFGVLTVVLATAVGLYSVMAQTVVAVAEFTTPDKALSATTFHNVR